MSYKNDKNKISTAGLPEMPKEKTERQELLKQGYRLSLIDGEWYAEKDGEKVKTK